MGIIIVGVIGLLAIAFTFLFVYSVCRFLGWITGWWKAHQAAEFAAEVAGRTAELVVDAATHFSD